MGRDFPVGLRLGAFNEIVIVSAGELESGFRQALTGKISPNSSVHSRAEPAQLALAQFCHLFPWYLQGSPMGCAVGPGRNNNNIVLDLTAVSGLRTAEGKPRARLRPDVPDPPAVTSCERAWGAPRKALGVAGNAQAGGSARPVV